MVASDDSLGGGRRQLGDDQNDLRRQQSAEIGDNLKNGGAATLSRRLPVDLKFFAEHLQS